MNFNLIPLASFSIKIFAFFATFAFGFAAWGYYQNLKKKNLNTEFFVHHFWRWVFFGLLLGRIIAFLLEPEIVRRHGLLGLFMFWDGGVHTLGTLFGTGIAMHFDTKWHNINSLRWWDMAVIPFLSALLVIDIGAFITGAWYGTPTSLPWGITYNTFGVEYVTAVHPVSLYAFILHYGILQWAKLRQNAWQDQFGRLTSYAIGLWAGAEVLLQLFRGDPTLTLFQVVRMELILTLIVAIMAFWWAKRTFTEQK